MLKTTRLFSIFKNNTFNQFRRMSTNPQAQEMVNKMRAWQIHSYGDLSELQLTAARIPHIASPTDLLIRVNAASLNPIDNYMMAGYGKNIIGMFRGDDIEFPLTLGRDFAGTIVDKGHGVRDEFKIGDNVYGVVPLHKQGAHAEMVIVNQSNILHQPSHLNAIEAASLLYTSMTAWSSLYISGELLPRGAQNVKVLILGASGGVGTVATQILKSQNAIVIGTCSTNAVPLVTSLGADFVFDYSQPDYTQKVALEGKYDIILDCAKLGHSNIPKTWEYDRYITLNSPLLVNTDKYGLVGGLAASLNELIAANVANCPSGKSVRWGYFVPSADGLQFIGKLIEKKQITPIIQKIFNFEDLPAAYKMLNAGHLRGKIIMDLKQNTGK